MVWYSHLFQNFPQLIVIHTVKGFGTVNKAKLDVSWNWTKVHDIVQETGIKTIPKEKKYKKAKWLSEEALQIAEKRREAKGKGEKERCPFECRVPKNSKTR